MWTEHYDQYGRRYYYNAAKAVSSWSVPPGEPIAPSLSAVPPQAAGGGAYQDPQASAAPLSTGYASVPTDVSHSYYDGASRVPDATHPATAACATSIDYASADPRADKAAIKRKADGSGQALGTSHSPASQASAPSQASDGKGSSQASSAPPLAEAPKDPAQALKDKLAALAQMQQSNVAKPSANKRFRKAAVVADDKPMAGGDGKSASAYLEMVRKLKSADKESDGTGGKWLVR